jgi:Holliday junction resolvase RusA-like endonuclease
MRIEVFGTPAPQGSKRAFVVRKKGEVGKGRAVVVESSAKVKPWRQDVKTAALEAVDYGDNLPVFEDCPVSVWIDFYLARPKGHYGTGRNAGIVKASASKYPTVKPDLDKLIRSTLDALTEAGVYGDDSQVISIMTGKFYADHRQPGALVHVEPAS